MRSTIEILAEQLESLLQRIRTGAFLPDTSRPGMVTDKTTSDPASTYKMAPIPEEASSSCSESSSTDSSDTEQSSQDDELPGLYDPIVTPEVWNPLFKMFKMPERKSCTFLLMVRPTIHLAVGSNFHLITSRWTQASSWSSASARGVR